MKFFDVGLSDLLDTYRIVETEKANYSLNAEKQSRAQKIAISEAEKKTQSVDIEDVGNYSRFPQGNFLGMSYGNIIGFAGIVAALAVLYKVAT